MRFLASDSFSPLNGILSFQLYLIEISGENEEEEMFALSHFIQSRCNQSLHFENVNL